MLKFGDKLDNGATVIASRTRSGGELVVLAHWRSEFVTWIVNSEGEAFYGHYHSYHDNDPAEAEAATAKAVQDFTTR